MSVTAALTSSLDLILTDRYRSTSCSYRRLIWLLIMASSSIISLPRGRVPLVRQGVRTSYWLLLLEGCLVHLDALGEGGACGVLLLFGRHVFKFGSYNYKRAFKFK